MPFIIAGVCLLFLAVLAIAISYICYRLTFKRRKHPTDPHARIKCIDGVDENEIHGLIDKLIAEKSECVEITSKDGLTLRGRLYLSHEGAPLKIMCHGYTSSPFRDMPGYALESLKRGYNLLLIDQRAHGGSEGRCITFGAKEKEDLSLWAQYCVKRTYGKSDIILFGLSMGGATVALASELELPKQVKCIVADCPYSSAEEMLKLEIKRRGLPVFLFYPMMRLGAKLFGNFSIKDCNVLSAVSHARLPILFIHGEGDDFVPCDMSRKLYESCAAEKELLTVERATHCLCFMTDRETYIRRAERFISKYAKSNPEGVKNEEN